MGLFPLVKASFTNVVVSQVSVRCVYLLQTAVAVGQVQTLQTVGVTQETLEALRKDRIRLSSFVLLDQ